MSEQFIFNISGTHLRVINFMAREANSKPYEVELMLASTDEIYFDDAIAQESLLTIRGQKDRYFHGIINKFIMAGKNGRYYLYQAMMVPSIWILSLRKNIRIFQKKSTKEIVTIILKEAGILSNSFSFRLQGKYEAREYCVQYRETDLDFISRLLEEEGIYYFFEHKTSKHKLIFGDSPVCYTPINGQSKISFKPSDGMVATEEFINSFSLARQIQTGSVTLKDFFYEKPSLNLTSTEKASSFKTLEIYDYPGLYTKKNEGKQRAKTRLQESVLFGDMAEGQGICRSFTPGFTFKLSDHKQNSLNQKYLLVEVNHSGSQPQALEERAGSAGFSYSNGFIAIPAKVTYKPVRNTPKPTVEGVQTAIVVGPSGEEIYTDKFGRVKVQFHWDRIGKYDEKSSCWIRVSQNWAGKNWGSFFLPRIGQEVIVDFLEGDPDRPIITGRVYNGESITPYNLPANKTKSTIKSLSSKGGGGFNEFRFEDKKDSEQIFVHAQKNMDVRVKNNIREWVGYDSHLIVNHDQFENVEGDKHLTVKGDHNEKIEGTTSIETQKDVHKKIGQNYAIDTAQEIHIKSGTNLIIEAGSAITLKAAGSFITIDSGGVAIKGGMIKLNSGGSPGSGAGATPDSPKEPSVADKADPGKKAKLIVASPFEREKYEPPASAIAQAKSMKEAAKKGCPFVET